VDELSGRAPVEARQRWRIVFRRDPDTSASSDVETAEAWVSALSGSGLPIAFSQGKAARARIALAAPLPAGVAGEAELVDVALTERLTRAELKAGLDGNLPSGDRLVDVFDVWLGEPTLASRLAAADYRALLHPPSASALTQACTHILARTGLPRSRPKGDGLVEYDLRPLVLGLGVSNHAGPTERDRTNVTTMRMRLRMVPDAASGRPDEVILALGDELGSPLVVDSIVRERLLTVDELGAEG
jgi:radical SAM-linked protein